MIIDAHHHLWRFDPVDYAWIDVDDLPLRRDFVGAELRHVARESQLTGTIVVQARQTLKETRWLLELADQEPLIRGVVGWVPLAEPQLPDYLDALAHRRLVGVRHVVQGEADPEFLMRPALHRGLTEISRRGLTYDLLIKAVQLPQAVRCVAQHPQLRFVLDHGGKPDIRHGGLAAWKTDLTALAAFPNVACKLSGLVTEADPRMWCETELTPYVRTILDLFGPRRVLFGSDWPVCLLGTSHHRWLAAVRGWITDWSTAEQAAVFGGNAITWYRLDLS